MMGSLGLFFKSAARQSTAVMPADQSQVAAYTSYQFLFLAEEFFELEYVKTWSKCCVFLGGFEFIAFMHIYVNV